MSIHLTRLETYSDGDQAPEYRVRGHYTQKCPPIDIEMGQVPPGGAWWTIPLPPCPDCRGVLEWAEAGHVPGARECATCRSLFLVDGRPEPPPTAQPRPEPATAADCGCGHDCDDSGCEAPDHDDCGCECDSCRRHSTERAKRWQAELATARRQRDADAASMRCVELSENPGPGWTPGLGGLYRCPTPGAAAVLPTPAGRSPAHGGPYCPAHGGELRARAAAARDWNRLAPESVGGEAAVQRAGCLALDSADAYVVVRPERDHWLAWLGIGSHMMPVRHGGMTARDRRRVERGYSPSGKPSCSYASQVAATAAALVAWRARVAEDVAEITAARGGTLTWGVPVEPRAEPRVIVLGEHGSAWDAL